MPAPALLRAVHGTDGQAVYVGINPHPHGVPVSLPRPPVGCAACSAAPRLLRQATVWLFSGQLPAQVILSDALYGRGCSFCAPLFPFPNPGPRPQSHATHTPRSSGVCGSVSWTRRCPRQRRRSLRAASPSGKRRFLGAAPPMARRPGLPARGTGAACCSPEDLSRPAVEMSVMFTRLFMAPAQTLPTPPPPSPRRSTTYHVNSKAVVVLQAAVLETSGL